MLDLSFRHYRGGAAPRNWHRNGELLYPGNPDKDLDEKAARKIAKYRELYRDHHRQLDFLPAIASTSGRIHCELLRLLFLHAHRETTPPLPCAPGSSADLAPGHWMMQPSLLFSVSVVTVPSISHPSFVSHRGFLNTNHRSPLIWL